MRRTIPVTVSILGGAFLGLVLLGVAALNCSDPAYVCLAQCTSQLCPLDPDAEDNGCTCTRACPADLDTCRADEDCAIVDAYCCAEPDIRYPATINKAYLADYARWQSYECAEGPQKNALQSTHECDMRCAALCRGKLLPVCATTGRCTVFFADGSEYGRCISDCTAATGDGDCAGKACGDNGAGVSCGECAAGKQCVQNSCEQL